MSISESHPSYTKYLPSVLKVRDSVEGEEVVKDKRDQYLPPTPAQRLDGFPKLSTDGSFDYDAYLMRANFPDYVPQALETFMGFLYMKEPVFKLPAVLEPLREKASNKGESLAQLLRRINLEQLTTGRVGLLGDFTPEGVPYISLYNFESIQNWDESDDAKGVNRLTYVLLKENVRIRSDRFNWKTIDNYKMLVLGDAKPTVVDPTSEQVDQKEFEVSTEATYQLADFEKLNGFTEASLRQPSYRGKTSDVIPFVVANCQDMMMEPEQPPLMGLVRMCFTIYRADADYRHTLFMQGQETLVIIGNMRTDALNPDSATRVGAGAKLEVDLQGDAKYVGVNSKGLSEQRIALENDKKQAESKAGQLVNPNMKVEESGQALHTRMGSQTASLMDVAMTGAWALKRTLKLLAEWMGGNPEEVDVTPNLEFTGVTMDGQQLVQLMTAREQGAPLSLESIHKVLQERKMTTMDFKAEMALIAKEDTERATRMAALPQPPVPAPAGGATAAKPFTPKPGNAPAPNATPKK